MTFPCLPDTHDIMHFFRHHHPTLIRFLTVGLTNFIISYLVFIICINTPLTFALKATLSQAISYSAGITWSFIWNRRWTFKSNASVAEQASRFLAVQITLLLLSTISIGLTVDLLHFSPSLSWLSIMTLITLLNYSICQIWVFNKT
jgi:putative flippase GtrA